MLKATGTKVDDLDFRMEGMRQQNVLGLQVAVNNLAALQEDQGTQHLPAESTDQTQGEAFELVGLDEFVQVHAEKFSRDAEVTAEVEALGEVDHAVLIVRILCSC